MKRRANANPMRLLIMLAVMWAAGSWLFAAESSPPARERPAPQTSATVPAAQRESPSPQAPASQAASEEDPLAAEESTEQPRTAASQEEASSQDDSEDNSQDKEESEIPKATSEKSESAADAGASPRRFVPSEQVRADFDVSFPIDI